MKTFLIQFTDGSYAYQKAESIKLLNETLDKAMIRKVVEVETYQRSGS